MAQPALSRTVQCLHCRVLFRVPDAAQVLTCPACYKRVRVEDVVISTAQFIARLETCGRIVVRRGGKVSANSVQASLGIDCLGEMEARSVNTSRLYLGPKARFAADCHAQSICIEPGATITAGRFTINPAGNAA